MHPPSRKSIRAERRGAATDILSSPAAAAATADTAAAAKEEQLPVESSFGCLFCPKRYNVADSLRKHMKNVHESSAATCKVCFEVFR